MRSGNVPVVLTDYAGWVAFGAIILVLLLALLIAGPWRATEADAEKGMISTSSPIGRAILNKEEGDEIKVVTPNGNKSFELIKLVTIHDEA